MSIDKITVDLTNEPSATVEITTDALILNSADYIPQSIINAKGDLIVGDASAEPTRMPIGSPDYFIVVDPTQDRGYKFTKELDGGTF